MRDSFWVEAVAKANPQEVRDKLPTTNLEGLIRNWDKIKGPPEGNPLRIPTVLPPLETELTSLTCSEL